MADIPNFDEGNVAKVIHDSVINGDRSRLAECITHFASYCFKNTDAEADPFPELLFQSVMDLLSRRELLEMEGSYELLMLFEYDWGRMTEAQKKSLLAGIDQLFDKFTDKMSYFVASELLGEYYCNEASLSVLCRLKESSNVTARALVPHGFEHIVSDASDETLKNSALVHLRSMKDDPSEVVQHEARVALANLGFEEIS